MFDVSRDCSDRGDSQSPEPFGLPVKLEGVFGHSTRLDRLGLARLGIVSAVKPGIVCAEDSPLFLMPKEYPAADKKIGTRDGD